MERKTLLEHISNYAGYFKPSVISNYAGHYKMQDVRFTKVAKQAPTSSNGKKE